jgi:hypothetical protein
MEQFRDAQLQQFGQQQLEQFLTAGLAFPFASSRHPMEGHP